MSGSGSNAALSTSSNIMGDGTTEKKAVLIRDKRSSRMILVAVQNCKFTMAGVVRLRVDIWMHACAPRHGLPSAIPNLPSRPAAAAAGEAAPVRLQAAPLPAARLLVRMAGGRVHFPLHPLIIRG